MPERSQESAVELQFPDYDLQRNADDLIQLDCRVELAAGFEQSLQPDDLLLRDKYFADFHQSPPSYVKSVCLSICAEDASEQCLFELEPELQYFAVHGSGGHIYLF